MSQSTPLTASGHVTQHRRARVLSAPIFVVGAACSGTTLLASTIRRNIDVTYTGEVNELWKRYVAFTKYDLIPEGRANDRVIGKVRDAFARLVEDTGGTRLLEKTPANTLRLPFVMRVFPDARVVHIIRDGRDVAVAVRRRFLGDHRKVTRLDDERLPFRERVRKALRQSRRKAYLGGSSLRLITNAPRYWTGALSMLGWKRQVMWGPRFPGFEAYYRKCSALEFAAVQWRECVSNAVNCLAALPAVNGNVCEVRYEELLADADGVMRKVLQFISAEERPIAEQIDHGVIGGGRTWRDVLTVDELQAVAAHIEHTLASLGYESSFTGPQFQAV